MKSEGEMGNGEWPKVALGEIAEPKQWPTLSKTEMTAAGFPVYGANGRIGYHHTFTHERPTILIGCRGSCGTVHVTEPRSYANGNAMALDALDETRADLGFLVHFFRKRGFRDVTTGTSQPQIIRQNLVRVEIPLPPLAEQRRIAKVLDGAEALRAKCRAALAQLDSLTQSLFLDLFGAPSTNPKGWPAKALGELVAEFRYGTSNKSASQGKPALRIPNVAGGTIDLTDLKLVPVDLAEFERLRLRDGDLLFVRTNGNPDFVGRCAVFDSKAAAASGFEGNEFIFASYLIRARLASNVITPLFLREHFLGAEGRRQLRSRSKTSAGQFNINTESLGAIPVPLPPLPLQREFARRVLAAEKLKTAQRASLTELDALFATLQHRAFRGEL